MVDGNGYTLIENCILNQKYRYIRDNWYKNFKDKYKQKRYFDYCKEDNVEGVYVCILGGLDPDKKDKKYCDFTGFIYACYRGNLKVAKLLYEIFQVDLNQTDCYNRTGLHFACQNNNIKIIKYLIQHGANINAKSSNGQTPLIIACSKNQIDIVKLIFQNNIKANEENIKGYTALMQACQQNYCNIIEYLANFPEKVDLDYQSKNGDRSTAFIEACKSKSLYSIKLFLRKNVNINKIDIHGKTGYDYLDKEQKQEIIKYINKKNLNNIQPEL